MTVKTYDFDELDKEIYQKLLSEIEKKMTTDKKKELRVLSKVLGINYEEFLMVRNEAKRHQINLKINLPTLEEYLIYLKLKGGKL